MMWFRGFKKLSLVDYPGKVASIAFTGGCDFRCPWCYVRDLVFNSPALPKISETKVLNYMRKYRDWIDGLVVSGGEPTIHRELPDFLEKVKKEGFSVALETNGSNPDMLEHLIEHRLIDYVEMDVKGYNTELYKRATGVDVDIKDIKRSIRLIKRGMKEYAFRTTVVPTIHRPVDVVRIAKMIRGAKRYYIQQFKHSDSLIDPSFNKIPPYSRKELEGIATRCKKFVRDVRLRNV